MSDASKSIGAIAYDVSTDLACRGCGYNLRSIEMSGQCPECGLPIGLSAKGDLLEDANPHWLRNLVVGLWMISIAAGLGRAERLSIIQSSAPDAIILGIRAGGILLALWGFFALTRAEPGETADGQQARIRSRLRTMVIISTFFGLIDLAPYTPPMSFFTYVSVSTIIHTAIMIPFVIFEFGYLIVLAGRIPDTFCAETARRLRILSLILVPITSCVSFLFGVGFTGRAAVYLWKTYGATSILRTLITAMSIVIAIRMACKIRLARRRAHAAWGEAILRSRS